jgi:hypothetical protein
MSSPRTFDPWDRESAAQQRLAWSCDACGELVLGSEGSLSIRDRGPLGKRCYPSPGKSHVIEVYHDACDPHRCPGYEVDCGSLNVSRDIWELKNRLWRTKVWFSDDDDLAMCGLVATAAVRGMCIERWLEGAGPQ